MLCSSDANISPILLFEEIAGTCSDHWYENKVKFSSLWAVNWKDLVVCTIFWEELSNSVDLSVVRSDHIDTVFCELAPGNFLEGLEAIIFQLWYDSGFLLVIERCSFELLLTSRYIDEQERLVSVKEIFILVRNITAFDFVLVEEHVRNLHQGWVHSILRVQEVMWVTSLNKPGKERCRPFHMERVRWTKLLLITNKHYLLSTYCPEESFILFDHRGFIHNYSLELSITQSPACCFSNCRHNYWSALYNFCFKGILVLYEDFKLLFCKHFDSFDIVAKEINESIFHLS